jgi:hypothetical protein
MPTHPRTESRTTDTRRLNWRLDIPQENPAEARLLAICTALAAEVAVLRERLDTHERLAAARGLYGPEEVDAYQPDAGANAARDRLRQAQIARVFRPLRDAAEREATAAAAGSAAAGSAAADRGHSD